MVTDVVAVVFDGKKRWLGVWWFVVTDLTALLLRFGLKIVQGQKSVDILCGKVLLHGSAVVKNVSSILYLVEVGAVMLLSCKDVAFV